MRTTTNCFSGAKISLFRVLVPGVCLVFLTLTAFYDATAQQSGIKPTRQSSLEAFSSGNFEKALGEFRQLLDIYPADPLYKYYAGICLVKLEKDPEYAVKLLSQARLNAALVRNVPDDVIFWLGRSQQMAGSFNDAVNSYEAFIRQAGKKISREMEVQKYLDQAKAGEGMVAVKDHQVNLVKVGENIINDEIIDTTVVSSVKDDVNSTGSQSEKLPGSLIEPSLDNLLSEALLLQRKADSLEIKSNEKTMQPGKGYPSAQERALAAKLQREADSIQNLADNKFSIAHNTMNSVSFTALPSDDTVRTPAVKHEIPDKVSDNKVDSVVIEAVAPIHKPVSDTTGPRQKNPGKKFADFYLVFEVKEKDAESDEEIIEVNPPIPPGLIYRIQTAVFRNPVAISYFKGVRPVFGFKPSGSALTTYYAGMFRKKADASDALRIIQQKGFRDAFIASFIDGKAISSERAASLEKEWANIPLLSVELSNTAEEDTIPPTLAFRVEVTRQTNPLDDEKYNDLQTISGSRGLDTYLLENGDIVYLIGIFLTYESASDYAGLLVRNGYREARVGAWLGRKEIPVETARQLFEKID